MSAAYILPVVNALLASQGVRVEPPVDLGDGSRATTYRRGRESHMLLHDRGLQTIPGDALRVLCASFEGVDFDEFRARVAAAGGLWRRGS